MNFSQKKEKKKKEKKKGGKKRGKKRGGGRLSMLFLCFLFISMSCKNSLLLSIIIKCSPIWLGSWRPCTTESYASL